MVARVIVYNGLMLLVDVAALVLVSPRRTLGRVVLAVAGAGLTAAVGAAALGTGIFSAAHLLAYGVFLHLFIVVAGCAVLTRARARVAASLAVAGLLLPAIAVDAFLIEPRWLEVSRFTVQSDEVPRRIRIAVVADLQTDAVGPHERAALAAVAREAPDLVLFAGDYLQVEDPTERRAWATPLRALLRAMPPPALGAFAVRGNVDHDDWLSFFDGSNARALRSTETVDVGPARVTGLSMEDSFDRTLRIDGGPGFDIVFGHSPDFALGSVGADVLIAGHTHGGQVRLPWIGPIVTLSDIPRAWAAGRTDLPGGRTLIVSRGVGMERGDAPRLRFLCRPEIVVVDVEPRAV